MSGRIGRTGTSSSDASGEAEGRHAQPHRMDADAVQRIVAGIRAHDGPKFGWAEVEAISGQVVPGGFTRQALMAHAEVYAAYVDKKTETGGARPVPLTVEDALRAEIAGLRSALQKLRRQIVRYQLNAELQGLDAEALDMPLHATEEIRKAERERLERLQRKRTAAQGKRAAARRQEGRNKLKAG